MIRHGREAKHQRGISLIEILIALLLISFGLLGVAQMFPGSARGQAKDRMLKGATFLAQEKLEAISNLTWSDPDLTVARHPLVGTEPCGENGRWGRYWRVSVMPVPLNNLKKVTVTVRWNLAAANDSISYVTYIRR